MTAAAPKLPISASSIDSALPEILKGLETSGAVVVEAPPGSGKTTRIPLALLEADWGNRGEILVVQPRRLPARLAATYVAGLLGEEVGQTVGYTVRFEEKSSARTRVRFVTEGVLVRRLTSDPLLSGVAAVLLDEFHERHVEADLALALLARLRAGPRPDVAVAVMSATLDGEPIRAFLEAKAGRPCHRVQSEARRFDVAIDHLATPDTRPLATQVASAVKRLARELPDGDILVFLPGAAEIRRGAEALASDPALARLLVVPLHGDLPIEGQARAVARTAERKVILATNVAETSVTIEGVVAVVDSGLARVASFSPWNGLPHLALAKISQASAIQRAGRAGRTQNGVALRLYTKHDFDSRRVAEAPEISRLDFAQTLLTLAGLGVHDSDDLWLTPPASAMRTAAAELLQRLGAVTADGEITERGRRMLRFPIQPRLGRLLVDAVDRGVAGSGATIAALIAERDIRRHGTGGADLFELLHLFETARQDGFSANQLRRLDLDGRATQFVEKARRQLLSTVVGGGAPRSAPTPTRMSADDVEAALARAVLAGFPDRVARRRTVGTRTVVMSGGGSAELGFDPESDFMVAIDVEERSGHADGRPPSAAKRTSIRLACPIAPDWLLDVEGGDLHETAAVELDAATERIVRRTQLHYGALVLDETVEPAPPGPETTRALAAAVTSQGIAAFATPEALAHLAGRLETIAQLHPELDVPKVEGEALAASVVAACDGLTCLDDLRTRGLVASIEAALPDAVRTRLATETPDHITLPHGRRTRVHYAPGQPPWISSRLQDFFGLTTGPTLAHGRVALTLHLLAPNGRAVQVTRDLTNFWRQHYPALRKQLSRRYPRHAWPEDGTKPVRPS